MLFAIGLLLLITPFPSFQTTANEKRHSTGSNMTKPSAVFTVSKPKPTAAHAKQTVHPTLKLNTGNQTILPTAATDQKPPKVNTTAAAKNKLNPAVIQTTTAPAVKVSTPSGTIANKDKPKASGNQTVTQFQSTSDVKHFKEKPEPSTVQIVSTPTKTAKASGLSSDKDKVTASTNQTTVIKAQPGRTKTIKNNLKPLVNQTISVKSHSGSEERTRKDNPAPTRTPDVQSASTKSILASSAKTTKEKLQPLLNQTVSLKTHSDSRVSPSKNKPAPTVAPHVKSISTKSASGSGAKTTKEKLQPLVNQTISVKSRSGSEVQASIDNPAPTGTTVVQSASTKSISASGAKTTNKNLHNLVNQTITVKPHSGSEVSATKHKSAPTRAPDVLSVSTKSTSASGAKTTNTNLHNLVNQTITVKPHSANEVSATKHKSAPTRAPDVLSVSTKSASGAKTTKEKLQPLLNQTVLVKPHSDSRVSPSKDKPAPTGASDVLSISTKLASASGAKSSKEKFQPMVNQTVSVKLPSINEGKTVLTTIQNVQSASASQVKTTKSKSTASVNQTVAGKSPSTSDVKNSKDKPTPTAVQTVLPTPQKNIIASGSAADKHKVNETVTVTAATTTEENPAPSQPVKVVISNECDSSSTKEQELKLQPGAPLVMTHKISLLPGGCTGECDAEMDALKGRVARLEREMSLLKKKCPCSENCPDNCSGNGECLKGKCICHAGFEGPDCLSCVQGAECNKKAAKSETKEAVETLTHQVNKNKDKGADVTDTKVATNGKPDADKTQVKTSVKKITTDDPTKISRVTASNIFPLREGRKQEEVRKGKPTVLVSKDVLHKSDPKIVKEATTKSDQLKDEPQSNITHSNEKKLNGTAKNVAILTKGLGTNRTRTGKETLKQSVLADKNVTQSSGHKHINVDIVDEVQTAGNRKTEAVKISKEKATQGSQSVVNQIITSSSDMAQVLQNKTMIHGSGVRKGMGGSGLGSVKVVNISSFSFTIIWLAPQGMFKNFTVIRREPWIDGDEEDREKVEEEPLKAEKNSLTKNLTEVRTQTESTDTAANSRVKAGTKRVSIVVPGSVRSVEFSNLRANTRYSLQIYGSGAEKRSKTHRVSAFTGPEPATDMVFSNVTESSLAVSWSKPKTTFTSFRVTYTNIVTGERHFVTVDSRQSHVVLFSLSAGSSYIISVTTIHGRAQSDALTSIITTVPAPPTRLQVINVTDTRAVLQWAPSLGKVDRFIISYESSKTPNVTVTVMLSGSSVKHQLRGLQRGTLYTVKVLSQKDSFQSTTISTTFTTANVVKASEVGPRSAVITWTTSSVVYHSYRLIYQVTGEEKKEIILDPNITEYKLTGLLPMTRYIALVQGERDGQYTSIVTTEFITGKLRFPFPADCSQELLNGALQSGEVDIYPQGKEGQAVRVYCDMETNGGGWTVFQRRINGKTDFYRTWSDYRAGFGSLTDEFWLGNELLHNLTRAGPVTLRVDMKSGNDTAYAHYGHFAIDSEERHYALTVSGFTGTAGDSMKYHNGRPFSTWDKDPDSLGIHCAKAYMGGWWYKNCYKTNLNGLYGVNSDNQGIVWIDWKGKDSSIPFTEMKIRPSRFSATHR